MSSSTAIESLTLVKFLLPLDNDVLALPATLGLIDTLCHRGALAHEVVAVDDASRDGTAEEARRFTHLMPLWLIQHRRRLGRAHAFRTALAAACRDAADEDLLLPIDPRRRPELMAALKAIGVARRGCEAVRVPAGRESWRGQLDQIPEHVVVYRAGLIKRHLPGFLEAGPAAESAAIRQLEQYLMAVGVRFQDAAPARPPVHQPLPGAAAASAPVASRGR